MNRLSGKLTIGILRTKVIVAETGAGAGTITIWGRRIQYRVTSIVRLPLLKDQQLGGLVIGRIYGTWSFGRIKRRFRVDVNEVRGVVIGKEIGQVKGTVNTGMLKSDFYVKRIDWKRGNNVKTT